jgi:hypothetical protein
VTPSEAEPAPPKRAFRCSVAAEQRGDELAGTASPATGFLLVEQPGAWGRHALTESSLDPIVGAAISARAAALGLRVLLIRRHGRTPKGSQRRWALVDCMPTAEWMRCGTFEADTELLELPLDSSAGERTQEHWYLVCTHGRHDACCALRGRPVAAALAQERPASVWECSHVGGDRFAANVLALPHGLYYGRVVPGNAAALVAAHEAGQVLPQLLRGRSSFPPVVQAAQQHARLVYGDLGVNDLLPRSVVTLAPHVSEVHLARHPHDLAMRVRAVPAGVAGLLTCAATHATVPRAFVVEAARETNDAHPPDAPGSPAT